jgi:FMN-dependent NADH-azoreductase
MLRNAFFSAYQERHPDCHRVVIDLANEYSTLPVFDEWDIMAKFEMLYGAGTLTEAAAERWIRLTAMTDKLHTADLVVVSCPMWNFSIPWHLKRWLDCVVQPRLTFEVDGASYRGLLTGRSAVLLVTRDGRYPPGSEFSALDFQLPYLRTILGFMGLAPIHQVVAEPLAMAAVEVAAAALQSALLEAGELGSTI